MEQMADRLSLIRHLLDGFCSWNSAQPFVSLLIIIMIREVWRTGKEWLCNLTHMHFRNTTLLPHAVGQQHAYDSKVRTLLECQRLQTATGTLVSLFGLCCHSHLALNLIADWGFYIEILCLASRFCWWKTSFFFPIGNVEFCLNMLTIWAVFLHISVIWQKNCGISTKCNVVPWTKTTCPFRHVVEMLLFCSSMWLRKSSQMPEHKFKQFDIWWRLLFFWN